MTLAARTSMYHRYYHDPGGHNTRAQHGIKTYSRYKVVACLNAEGTETRRERHRLRWPQRGQHDKKNNTSIKTSVANQEKKSCTGVVLLVVRRRREVDAQRVCASSRLSRRRVLRGLSCSSWTFVL